jgi:replicative DNA helicase
MAKIKKDGFGYLGRDFQYRLIYQLLTDKKFTTNIIDIIDPNYFEDEYLRMVSATIKGAHEKDESVPDFGSLKIRLLERVNDEIKRSYILEILAKIENVEVNDSPFVQDMAMKFCKQQELKKTIGEISKIIDKGDVENYNVCEDLIRKALEIGNNKDDGINVTDNIDDVLSDDFRDPIPTGISGLDDYMQGGLSKGELAVILAPFGVGKTTMITKIANSAHNEGHNVLQIFFEDNKKVIQRKHFSCWTNIELNELANNKEIVKEEVIKRTTDSGTLTLKKFPSDGTTIPKIKQYIRRLIARGKKPDLVLLDYIDCVQPTKQFKNEWDGEGNVMRQFESMLDELDIAGWTAVQGNRSSIGSEIVEADQIGGSIKKGQIGHFIVSVAKSLDQKDNGTANMAILKSRFGKDGVRFDDIIFDNSRIQIDMTESIKATTFRQAKVIKEAKDNDRVVNVYSQLQARKEQNKESSSDDSVVIPITNDTSSSGNSE